jgi:hypothetical protein
MNEFGEANLAKETGGLALEVGGLLLFGKSLIELLMAFPGLPIGPLAQGALGLGAMFVGNELTKA